MTPTVFTWGYEGWGNATRELARSFAAVEASRGFGPPVFVDVRARRQGRALGFQEDTFERRVRRDSYRWLPGLGNKAILSGRGPMRLCHPGDARELLGIVLAVAGRKRRILFFCSCGSPERCANCHRQLVRQALLREARRIGQQLRIQEWPGGDLSPRVQADVRVTPEVLAKLRRGRTTVPLGTGLPSVDLLALPPYSLVRLYALGEKQLVSALPARFGSGRWSLPIGLREVLPDDKPKDLLPSARRERRNRCLEASNA